jgi:hypothetical protein
VSSSLAPAQCARFAPQLLLAKLAQPRRFLLLAFYARLLVVLPAPGLGEDPVLLNPLVKPFQRAFERLIVANNDFGQ